LLVVPGPRPPRSSLLALLALAPRAPSGSEPEPPRRGPWPGLVVVIGIGTRALAWVGLAGCWGWGGGGEPGGRLRLEVARWQPSRRTAPEDRAHRVLFPLRGVVGQQALHLQRISEARGHQSSNPNRLICTMVNSFYSIDWQNLGLFLTWLFLCVW
jgi:hypothetical protein